jgi:hypothetical protein
VRSQAKASHVNRIVAVVDETLRRFRLYFTV